MTDAGLNDIAAHDPEDAACLGAVSSADGPPAEALEEHGGPAVDRPGPFFSQDVTGAACFVCAVSFGGRVNTSAPASGAVRTKEHVVPQWILRDHDMFNQAMTLPNGTLLRYDQLVVPACESCNSGHLRKLEDTVSEAFRSGTDAVRTLDRRSLYLWLVKMFYGLRYRELSLPLDQTDPSSLRIVAPDELRAFSFLHTLMQSARGLVDWTPSSDLAGHDIPGSIIILPVQVSPEAQYNFGYVDSTEHPYIAVRVGPTAVLAVLEDWGAWERNWTAIDEPDALFPELFAAKNLTLSPDQFVEVAVLTDHLNQKIRRNRTYMQVGPGPDGQVRIILANTSPLSTTAVDREWFLRYASHLGAMTHRDPRTLYDPETGMRSTLLVGEDMLPHKRSWSGKACVNRRCDHSDPIKCDGFSDA